MKFSLRQYWKRLLDKKILIFAISDVKSGIFSVILSRLDIFKNIWKSWYGNMVQSIYWDQTLLFYRSNQLFWNEFFNENIAIPPFSPSVQTTSIGYILFIYGNFHWKFHFKVWKQILKWFVKWKSLVLLKILYNISYIIYHEY